MTGAKEKNLLIVGNFAANTGYAWNTISEYFIALAKMMNKFKARTLICYPEVGEVPEKLSIPELEIVKLDFSSVGPLRLFLFLRKNRINCIYLTDRPVFSWKYMICRVAGVRRIVVHDRTSGDRNPPGLVKGFIKRAINSYPVFSADIAVAISDFVKNRLARVNRFPVERIVRIWNGIDVDKYKPGYDDLIFDKFGISRGRKVVFAYSRANLYKGIQTLIEAADIIVNKMERKDICFLYCGDGPDLDNFREMVRSKGLSEDFLCPGKTGDIDRILRGVSIVAVPSLWQEGFGLSVVEGMASGKGVIASRVGGIPEIIEDGENGILFPAGDAEMLSIKILSLADDTRFMESLGYAARETALRNFNLERQKEDLTDLFRKLLWADEIG